MTSYYAQGTGNTKKFISLPLPLKLFIQSLNYVKTNLSSFYWYCRVKTFFSEHHGSLLDVSTVSSLLFLPIYLLRIFSPGAFLNSHHPTSNLYHNNGNLIVSLEHETYIHTCVRSLGSLFLYRIPCHPNFSSKTDSKVITSGKQPRSLSSSSVFPWHFLYCFYASRSWLNTYILTTCHIAVTKHPEKSNLRKKRLI